MFSETSKTSKKIIVSYIEVRDDYLSEHLIILDTIHIRYKILCKARNLPTRQCLLKPSWD